MEDNENGLQLQQGERLNEVLKSLKMSANKFAKSIGMEQSQLNRAKNGQIGISVGMINAIKRVYKNISVDYLLTGQGQMFLPEETEKIDVVEERQPEYGYDLIDASRLYQELRDIKMALQDYDERLQRLEDQESE